MQKKLKNTNISFLAYLFFVLVYANQGISSLPGQCIYYLSREVWGLSATVMGLIGIITGFAWYIKPLFGIPLDYFPIKKYRTKYYLYFNYISLIITYLYIIFFGLNLVSLIITLTLINIFISFSDVANDTQMVILEQKYKLKGKIQALQWISLGVAGLFVSIVGAQIANYFPETINYRIAYLLAGILPIVTLVYLFKYYKEKPIKKKKNIYNLKSDLSYFKNKRFLFSLLFIACLQFTPNFGMALMIQARENMGISKLFLGYLGATGTVLSISGYILYYWKFHKYPVKSLLYFMVIFTAITNLFYLYIPNQWFLMGYSVLFGAFGGITFLTLLSFFARITPKGSEGIYYAVVTSISNFCSRGGGFLGGIIYDHWGYSATVLLSSILTLCCIIFIPYLKIGEEDVRINCKKIK